MSRRQIALKHIDITEGRGLELGPLANPIVLKNEAKISYVDHMSTEGLRKKYKGHPFPPEDIVPVDYVLKNNSLQDTLKGRRFDYVIASHVIEHIPDIVTWLKDVESILNEGGILSLVIPDKRFTFDILRNESRSADVIGAYLDRHTRASSATMYDFVSGSRDIDTAEVWRKPYANYSRKPGNSLEKAYEVCLENLDPENYVDSHCFVFTPHSFFEVVRSLVRHDLLNYEIAHFKDTPKNQLEFYVSLRKASKSTQAQKLTSIPKLPKPTGRRQLEGEVAKLRDRLNNITTSKSWKLTKPMRQTLKVAKKVRRK